MTMKDQVLAHVREHGPIRGRDIAKALGIEPASVYVAVSDLRKAGHLEGGSSEGWTATSTAPVVIKEEDGCPSCGERIPDEWAEKLCPRCWVHVKAMLGEGRSVVAGMEQRRELLGLVIKAGRQMAASVLLFEAARDELDRIEPPQIEREREWMQMMLDHGVIDVMQKLGLVTDEAVDVLTAGMEQRTRP